jgi:ABC-type nitrate/sulfonate/bicarbonate transport system substrate-binding protein
VKSCLPRSRRWALASAALLGVAVVVGGAMLGRGGDPTLRVELGSRAVSKLPFLIAADQGLYEKYGLNVDLRMPNADFPGGLGDPPVWRRAADRILGNRWRAEVFLNGATPEIVGMVNNLDHPRSVLLASTDCHMRSHVVARPEIGSLEELKGKRIGVTGLMENITAYVALELADRMGWDPVHDVSLIRNGADVSRLRDGSVDAIIARERDYAALQGENFSFLLDTRSWGPLPIGGNSVRVGVEWYEDAANVDKMRRFLMALVEGIALFHEDRDLAIDVLERWNGVPDWYAEIMYDQAMIPQVPFPCYDGIRRTMEFYDSHEMRRYVPEDFYDDGLLLELEESGFIRDAYARVRADR